ncbi:MAG: 1-deoxy-D-xylulose-5-phosphate synthase [Bacillota bacterium]|nr:1-deoxy-D-xylulose-5-phosphate synthase [Bacillota bacterium]
MTAEPKPRQEAPGLRLAQIDDPKQLLGRQPSELEALAAELRDFIVEHVAATGGHLASNLGTVELTLALLSVFDPGSNPMVWDVGHQSYVYKILTGRHRQFAGLRQEGGISGFPKREESPYDVFNTGHSSTSISAALGIARGLALRGEKGRAVAIIGDGALTGGLAFEALNDIRQGEDDLIVIINDNQMSIDPNVGGLARHLDHIRTSTRYLHMKSRLEETLERLPVAGRPLSRFLEDVKRRVRRLKRRSATWFECLGLRYYGPVDGHDIAQLQRYLIAARTIKRPVVIHVLTQKGRGYEPAELEPERFHGVAPFKPVCKCRVHSAKRRHQPTAATAAVAATDFAEIMPPESKPSSFSQAFGRYLMQAAARDPRVVAITAAMAQGTGLEDFQACYPERFYDVGIAEQHAVTLACGLATAGMRPVVAVYSTFLQRAFDQVLHDAALQHLPVIFAVDRAGIVGEDGETHQGIYDLAFLNAVPGLQILCPRDYRALEEAFDYAFRQPIGPVVIRYPRGPEASFPVDPEPQPPLPAAWRLVEGQDLTIVALGAMLEIAARATRQLAERGIRAELIDARAAKPLDLDTIVDSARRTGNLITIEEVVYRGGLGMTGAAAAAVRGLEIRIRTLAIGDHPVTQARVDRAREREGLAVDRLLETADELLGLTSERRDLE